MNQHHITRRMRENAARDTSLAHEGSKCMGYHRQPRPESETGETAPDPSYLDLLSPEVRERYLGGKP